jgi:hypothetical protein
MDLYCNCGKKLNKSAKQMNTQRCRECWKKLPSAKDLIHKELNDYSYDAVDELSERNYGRRLVVGFALLEEN